MTRRIACALLVLTLAMSAWAQNNPPVAEKKPVPGTLTDLAFMAGCWKATHWSGEMDECWSGPLGDNMSGMFRFVKDGQVQFYEFIVVEQTPEGLYLRLKHFNKGLIGWEEKEKSIGGRLTALEKNKATFDWLTYELRAPDTLVVSFRLKRDDQVTTEVIEFQRIK